MLKQYERFIAMMARKMSRGKKQVYDDLVSIGTLYVLEQEAKGKTSLRTSNIKNHMSRGFIKTVGTVTYYDKNRNPKFAETRTEIDGWDESIDKGHQKKKPTMKQQEDSWT